MPALRTECADKLAKLAAAHPNDLSVATAGRAGGPDGRNRHAAPTAVERLIKLTEQTPLEALATGARPNSRQRARSLRPNWALARRPRMLETAGAFMTLGKSLPPGPWPPPVASSIALMRWPSCESGQQIDLEHGDKTSAEARFREIVDVLLPRRVPAKGSDEKAARAPVVTTDQFRQSVEFARLAAENGLLSVSRQTVRRGARRRAARSARLEERTFANDRIRRRWQHTAIQGLSSNRWLISSSAGGRPAAKPDEIYETLAAVVLPKPGPTRCFFTPAHVNYAPAGDRKRRAIADDGGCSGWEG